jgi:hypothetical protein
VYDVSSGCENGWELGGRCMCSWRGASLGVVLQALMVPAAQVDLQLFAVPRPAGDLC